MRPVWLQLMAPNEAFVEHVQSGTPVGRLDDEDIVSGVKGRGQGGAAGVGGEQCAGAHQVLNVGLSTHRAGAARHSCKQLDCLACKQRCPLARADCMLLCPVRPCSAT